MKDNLQIFLYVLMRDHLPCGVVRELIKETVFKAEEHEEIFFTNPDLERMAASYAADIRRGRPQDPAVLAEMAKQTEWG